MSQPNSATTQTSAAMSGTGSLPVSGGQAVSPLVIEVSIGHQHAGQGPLPAPDLGAQNNAAVKTVRIAARGWDEGGRFVDAERFWSQLDDEVSAVYPRCWMYPNLKTVHLTVAGLEEAYLPAGAPATFAVVYRTDTDTVHIADVEGRDKQLHQHQQQQDAAPGDGGKRDLVVHIDIDPAVVDRHTEPGWAPVLCKEAVECEDAYLDSPEFHHRLVWEIAQRIVDERLWKPTPRVTPIVVGNLALMPRGGQRAR
ncbi:hypothetical protein LX32DRAFT_681938 [Colletotrichum zoysiae]|uniref:Uncharacterized protein n=1 Tax=Colletotrichum zoysiae TaxID=1216348 RepID=A0AAD9M388_9PEZI|nr:hypothetical protein LX32DRAFT_681938 [Colletotrichum zoysiae]